MTKENQTITDMTSAAKKEATELLQQDKKEPKKHSPKPRPPQTKAKWQEDLQKIKETGVLKKGAGASSSKKPVHKKKTDGIKTMDGTSAKPKVDSKKKK